MSKNSCSALAVLTMVLILAGPAFSQTVRKESTLAVSGQQGQAAIVQMDGKSYVEIESLARLLKGSLSFSENQVKLTLPTEPGTAASANVSAQTGLSKGFVRAAIETLSTLSAWRGVMVDNIQHSYPFDATWFTSYIAEANKNLGLAGVAASTEADRSALQLLSAELDNMQALTNTVLDNLRTMHYMAPGYLDDNALGQKVVRCEHFIASMVASGQFADDGSCH